MVFLFLNIFYFPSLLLSKGLFKKWINPLSIYATIWYFMLTFYHLKLINYVDLSLQTWYVIGASYFALFLGSITFFTARNSLLASTNEVYAEKSSELPSIFENRGQVLFRLSLVFGIIGLFSAVHTWFVVLKIFHTPIGVFTHLGKIYQMRVAGELKGIIPFLSIFIYASIFFAAIYSAFSGKIKLISLLPLFALLFKQIILASRASILLGFLEYAFSFLLAFYLLNRVPNKSVLNKKVLGLQIVSLLLIFLVSIIAIKNLRGTMESFTGETRVMKKLENSPFISPSIYLYLSGHVGVLEKYLSKNEETARFGENSLQFVYNFLSKFNFVEKPQKYQKGYYIPLWINTGTFIRELISDYTFPGALIFVFSLGFISAYSWNKMFTEKNIYHLAILAFLMIVLSMSFLMIITRLANWILSLIFILITIKILNRKSSFKKGTIVKECTQN